MRVAAIQRHTRNGQRTKILCAIAMTIVLLSSWSMLSKDVDYITDDDIVTNTLRSSKQSVSNNKAIASSSRPEGGLASSVTALLSLTHEEEVVPEWKKTKIVEPHTGYKKVLVTGAAGFIGSHVAEHLLERGDDVVIVDEVNDYYDVRIKNSNLDMLLNKYGPKRVQIYKGDICNTEFITNVFEETKPEWVCHMAARAGVRPSIQDPYIYIHSNVEGTTRLMELSKKYNVKNFVFASSSSVYGGSKSTFFSESENVDHPISPYAASKKSCELMSYTFHHLYNLNVTALRFFTVFGPRGRPDMAPFVFVDRVSRGLSIQQYGDGSSSRDYTYISDIVDGVVRAVDRPYAYEIFNLGKGSGTSLKEFISLVGKTTGKEVKIEQLPDQPGDVPYTCADVSKAEYLLGYKAKVSFEEGIKKTVDWYNEAFKERLLETDDDKKEDRRRLSYFMEDEGSVLTVNDEMLVPDLYWSNE